MYINFNNAVQIGARLNMLRSDLKRRVFKEFQIPVHEQKIYFNGLIMVKEQTLAEYGIRANSSLYLNTETLKGKSTAGTGNERQADGNDFSWSGKR